MKFIRILKAGHYLLLWIVLNLGGYFVLVKTGIIEKREAEQSPSEVMLAAGTDGNSSPVSLTGSGNTGCKGCPLARDCTLCI